mmetsp:Transcript_37199/g.112479  ORF Transcript_37199/g.112479 Transcript_37199/m.112479 type:complete len:203 (+) Transcript_37199:184-792(+)
MPGALRVWRGVFRHCHAGDVYGILLPRRKLRHQEGPLFAGDHVEGIWPQVPGALRVGADGDALRDLQHHHVDICGRDDDWRQVQPSPPSANGAVRGELRAPEVDTVGGPDHQVEQEAQFFGEENLDHGRRQQTGYQPDAKFQRDRAVRPEAEEDLEHRERRRAQSAGHCARARGFRRHPQRSARAGAAGGLGHPHRPGGRPH